MVRIARTLLVALALLSLLPALFAAAPSPAWESPDGARQLVRTAVANQLQTGPDHRFMFRLTVQKPGLVQVKDNVETDEGVVSRLVAVNGQPLTPQQQAAEDARLQKLLRDPRAWAKKRKEQQEDDARTQRMMQALPDAFLFEYEGAEPGPWGEMIRLKFSPDPAFKPPSRESEVFQGMQGEIWVDANTAHLVRIDGALLKGVNLGFGALGHLDKGGRFLVEQSRLDSEHWDVTHMTLQFTGKAFFVVKINLQEEQTMSDFRPVPVHLSLKDGIGLLGNPETMAAARPGSRR